MRHAVVVTLVLLAAPVRADKWPAPQVISATSPSGAVNVVVDGVTIKVTRAGKVATFQGVNAVAPVTAFACDDGSVVTLNEWHHVGYAHAIVIYAPDGRVVADRALEEILTADELASKVVSSVSSRWWLAEDKAARCEGAVFVAPTRWGAVLTFALADGTPQRPGAPIPPSRQRLIDHARGARLFQDVSFRVETARRSAAGPLGGVRCTLGASQAACKAWGRTLADDSEGVASPAAVRRALRAWAQLVDLRHLGPERALGDADQILIDLTVMEGGYGYTTTWLLPLDPGSGPAREAIAVLMRLGGQRTWPP